MPPQSVIASYGPATEIGQTITTLQQKGAEVDISWTPGHASIAGNEIVDALVKETAMEAMIQPEGRNSSTILENKEATKKTQISKWQSRWDNTEYGRVYNMLVSKVDSKKFLDILNRKSFCLILQIQTGYSKLKDYRYKLGQCDSNKAKKRKCLVSGYPTDPNILGPTQTFLKTLGILRSKFSLFLRIFLLFPYKKVFIKKKVCLPTDPKNFGHVTRNKTYFSFGQMHLRGTRDTQTLPHRLSKLPALLKNYATEVIIQLGLYFLDAHTLLSNEEHPELPDWRETIRQEVAAYIKTTGCFSEEFPD